MGKATTGALAMGGLGTVLIAAAQTKPEDAASNIASWLRMLGVDKVPDTLIKSDVDAWATITGLTFMGVAIFVLWALKWSPKDFLATLLGEVAQLSHPATVPVNVTAPDHNEVDDSLIRLIAKRERMEADEQRLALFAEQRRKNVEDYARGIDRFSKNRITRPTTEHDNPDLVVQRTIASFADFKSPEWAKSFNRPAMTFGEWQNPMLQQRLQLFDPAHNQHYIGLHRENLTRLREALAEYDERVASIRTALAGVKTQILEKARVIDDPTR